MSEQLMAMPEADDLKVSVDAMSTGEVDGALDGITMATFGSQLMKEYDGVEDLPVMTGGPTWTGSGATQDADDGDTGGGGPGSTD